MTIRDLASHETRYVTIAELAEYWGVSRQHIYKNIQSGALEAIQLGSRLVRVPAKAALDYERRARVDFARSNHTHEPARDPASLEKLPATIGVKRMFRK